MHGKEKRKDQKKERNRSYSVCLVVGRGLCDFGIVSATYRAADALRLQSVHVVSCDGSIKKTNSLHLFIGSDQKQTIWRVNNHCCSTGVGVKDICMDKELDCIIVYSNGISQDSNNETFPNHHNAMHACMNGDPKLQGIEEDVEAKEYEVRKPLQPNNEKHPDGDESCSVTSIP